MTTNPHRRRAPYWVRQYSDGALHGLAGKLARLEHTPEADFSDRQSWLLDACISELEWRARRDRRDGISSCTCAFCFGPFPEGGDELEL
jgi:hypothetical protein